MMRTTLVAVLMAALIQFGPMLAVDIAGASGTSIDALDGVGTAHAAFIRRTKIKKKRTVGYRVVVVVGDDAEANEVNTVDVSIAHAPGQPVPIGGTTVCDEEGNCATTVTARFKGRKSNGNKRFVFKDLDFSEDADNFSYRLTTTMKDAIGDPVGAPLTEIIEVEAAGDTRVRAVTVKQLDPVYFELKVTVVDDLDDEVNAIYFTFDDFEGPEPEPDDSFTMTNPVVKRNGTKVFTRTLTFAIPDAVADQVYGVIVDLRNADLEALGSSSHEVVVEGLEIVDVASCEDGTQNGSETGVDCGGSDCPACGPDITIAQAAALLQGAANAETAAAAELLGEATVPGNVGVFVVGGNGNVVFTDLTESGLQIVVVHGPTSVTFDGEEALDVAPGSALSIETNGSDDGSVTSTIRVHDEAGNVVGELTSTFGGSSDIQGKFGSRFTSTNTGDQLQVEVSIGLQQNF